MGFQVTVQRFRGDHSLSAEERKHLIDWWLR
jgi:hypothetical protein